ncbi:MAG TPA: protein kinase [Polyangiales bacterium]
MPQGDGQPVQPDSSDTLAAGSLLGDYEVVRALGKGGMAIVYEGRHRALHKRVALKVLQSGGRKADLSRRFLREAENAARLSHPHVVDVSHVGTAQDGLPYLVMEYLEGEDLGQHLARVGKLSVEATADLLVPVACAIAAAHESGVVHRDLKPQNIFLCKARGGGPTIPKVVDFGVSKLLDSQSLALTDTDAIIGTPFYMSPEQAMEAKHVDARTDQFSFGVILYECVTGHRPFQGDSLFSVLTSIVHVRQELPSSLSYPMDPEFEALVERALEKKPEERFATMQALGRELLRFASLRVQISAAAELGVDLPAGAASGPREAESRRDGRGPTPAQNSTPVRAAGGAKPSVRPQRARWLAPAALALVGLGLGTWLLVPSQKAHREPPRLPVVAPAPSPAATNPASDWESEAPSAPAPRAEEPPVQVIAGGPAEQSASVNIQPVSARIELDGVLLGTGSASFRMPADGQPHQLHISADGYQPLDLVLGSIPPPSNITLQRASGRAAPLRESAPHERRVEGVAGDTPRAQRDPVAAAPSAPPASAPAAPTEAKPAAPRSGDFQAFPSARGGKRSVRPLDTRDPWK